MSIFFKSDIPFFISDISEINVSDKKVTSIWPFSLLLSIRKLNISRNPICYVPYIYSLSTLICTDCNISILFPLPNLTYLDCSNNKISSLPYFPLIETLIATKNRLETLPIYSRLKKLIISTNPIMSVYQPNLTYLEAYDCPILIVHYIPSLYKRSSYISSSGSVQQITLKSEKINRSYIVIDWKERTTSLTYTKLFSFLFKWQRLPK